jgi:glutamate-ammonia-ligase adenylyltransferase
VQTRINNVLKNSQNDEIFVREIRRIWTIECERVGFLNVLSGFNSADSSSQLTKCADLIFGAISNWLDLTVIAMGSYGGSELGLSSDFDIVLLKDDSSEQVHDINKILALLRDPYSEFLPIDIDMDLRPEGKNGALIRTITAYENYYSVTGGVGYETWEKQAMIKARFVAGSDSVRERFESVRSAVLGTAINESQTTEIRLLKARVENERIENGVSKKQHIKLGPGGISDICWAVQFLELKNLGLPDFIAEQNTMNAIKNLENEDKSELTLAFSFLNDIKNAIFIMDTTSQKQNIFPSDFASINTLENLLGVEDLENKYLETMRHIRKIFEEIMF